MRLGSTVGLLLVSSYFLDFFPLDYWVIPPDLLCSMFTIVKGAAVFVAVAMHGTEEAIAPACKP